MHLNLRECEARTTAVLRPACPCTNMEKLSQQLDKEKLFLSTSCDPTQRTCLKQALTLDFSNNSLWVEIVELGFLAYGTES